MNRYRVIAVALLAVVVLSDLPAHAQTPDELYQQMYGQTDTTVRRSREFEDDVQFAEQLLAAAGQLADNPKFAAYLCDKSAQIAGRRTEGTDVAVRAQRKRMQIDSSQTDAAMDQIVLLRERAYQAARGGDRTTAGAAFIEELIQVARQHQRIDQYAEAATMYRKAAGIARSLGSPQLDAINDQAERAAAMAGAQRQLDTLKGRLERDAADKSAHRDLATLYLCDLENFDAAASHAGQSGDDALQAIAQLHRTDIGKLSDAESLTMADWCTAAAANSAASSVAKVNLLQRAKSAYQRYLSVHTAGDIDRLRAATALAKVQEDLDRLKPAKIGAAPVIGATAGAGAVAVNPSAKSVKGTLYAAGDYFLNLRVNGKEVCSGSYSTLCSASVELRDGDVVTAHVQYYDEDFYDGTVGFWCMFVADTGSRNSFMTNVRDWYVYTPTNDKDWSQVDVSGRNARASLARPFPIKLSQVVRGAPGINSADSVRNAMLWGSTRGADTYFFHVASVK